MATTSWGSPWWAVTVSRLGPIRAFVRAVLYAVFPLGLLWCAISAKRHSLQDVALRTQVVYAWLPHPVDSHSPEVEGWR